VGLLQAKVITSLGAQPELLTLGHNPYKNEYIDTHIVLPTTRPKVRLQGSWRAPCLSSLPGRAGLLDVAQE
jgi:hypothetical protein